MYFIGSHKSNSPALPPPPYAKYANSQYTDYLQSLQSLQYLQSYPQDTLELSTGTKVHVIVAPI